MNTPNNNKRSAESEPEPGLDALPLTSNKRPKLDAQDPIPEEEEEDMWKLKYQQLGRKGVGVGVNVEQQEEDKVEMIFGWENDLEGYVFTVHRSVLLSRSPVVFKEALEKGNGSIFIPFGFKCQAEEREVDDGGRFLKLLYRGEIYMKGIDFFDVVWMMGLCRQYKIPLLEETCVEVMPSLRTRENCFAILKHQKVDCRAQYLLPDHIVGEAKDLFKTNCAHFLSNNDSSPSCSYLRSSGTYVTGKYS